MPPAIASRRIHAALITSRILAEDGTVAGPWGSISDVKDFDSIFPGAFIAACVITLVLLVVIGKVLG